MRAASPPRQMERENEMIVISHRPFLWTIRAGRDSHALHRHFERSEKSFLFAVKRCICGERKTGNSSSRNLRAKPAIMTQSLVKLRPTPSFRAKREIFFVRGKTVHKRRTKNGKPVIRGPTGKASHNDAQPHEAAPQHRHFERSEKSFSYVVRQTV